MDKYEEYKSILSSVERDGIKELIDYLDTTDFKIAPASTKFHSNFTGGLCEHSLNVYYNMLKLRDTFYPELPDETVKIVALLHDISKTGLYEEYAQNKKVYSENGLKRDELGKFEWVATKAYKVKENSEKELIMGEHGVNSFYIVNKFVRLTDSEASAIINHHGGMDNGFVLKDLTEALNRYPTLTLLHMADFISCFITENPYMVENE